MGSIDRLRQQRERELGNVTGIRLVVASENSDPALAIILPRTGSISSRQKRRAD